MVIVRVIGRSDGLDTPHDGKFVCYWNPHTEAGILELVSTHDKTLAKRFESFAEAAMEWKTQSQVEPIRPWDGKPNRPLTGITIEVENLA